MRTTKRVENVDPIQLNALSKLGSGRVFSSARSWLAVHRVRQSMQVLSVKRNLTKTGRYDMEVDPNTVDFSIQRLLVGIDQTDYQISRQYTYFTRMVRAVRSLNNIYYKVKEQKNWGSDPQFTKLNPTVKNWLDGLPGDLQIEFRENGDAPWIPSHFAGNMHSYHHLIVIMLHRPQLMSSSTFSAGGSWKQHMALSYSSAKAMCRLQEGVLRQYGLHGLQCMIRGINFVIYAVLTCTMIHLVSLDFLSSPRSC